MKHLTSVFFLLASSCALAQPAVLLEACNAIKNGAKRLECLKAATAGSQPREPSQPAPPQPMAPGLSPKEQAAAACESIIPALAKRQVPAFEDTDVSTPTELALQWPADGDKKAMWCAVDRVSLRVVSLTTNGRTLSGPILAELELDAKQRKEIAEGNYQPFVARAKRSLASGFKDPDSAQFRDLFVSGDAMPVLCGEVNAKNSYGAYVGFRRFYATGKESLNSVESAKEDYVFTRMWPSMCGAKKATVD